MVKLRFIFILGLDYSIEISRKYYFFEYNETNQNRPKLASKRPRPAKKIPKEPSESIFYLRNDRLFYILELEFGS